MFAKMKGGDGNVIFSSHASLVFIMDPGNLVGSIFSRTRSIRSHQRFRFCMKCLVVLEFIAPQVSVYCELCQKKVEREL